MLFRKVKDLSLQLTLNFSMFIFFAILIFSLGVYFFLLNGLEKKDRELVRSKYNEISATLINKGIDAYKNDSTLNHEADLLFRFIDADKSIIYDKMPLQLHNFDSKKIENSLDQALPNYQFYSIAPEVLGEETIEFLSGSINNNDLLIVGLRTEASGRFLHLYIKAAVIISIISIVASILFGFLLSKKTLMPITELRRIIKLINNGEYAQLSEDGKSNHELNELVIIFNKMMSQIKQLISTLQHSLDAVAHDLRTPMTRLMIRFEDIANKSENHIHKDQIFECIEEVQNINKMLTTLLEISESEIKKQSLKLTTFDVRELLMECVDLYEFVAEDKFGQIEIICNSVTMRADRNRLKRVIANLIDNALKYSDENVKIKLQATDSGENIRLKIEDTGWGIAQQNLDKIWERLYRVDTSRSFHGMGLGLSLVKSIIEQHGWQIEVFSQVQIGTTFEIIIPKSAGFESTFNAKQEIPDTIEKAFLKHE